MLGNDTMTKLESTGYVLSVGDGIARVYGLYDVFFVECFVLPLFVYTCILIGLCIRYKAELLQARDSVKLVCYSVFARLMAVELFKDGRNLPLSFSIAVVFLGWSFQQGFLSQMSLSFQLVWLAFYSYSMYNYRYNIGSLLGRLPLVILLMVLKWVVSLEVHLNVSSFVPQVFPQKSFLPAGLVGLVLVLDFLSNQVVCFVTERDYWALLLLLLPGFSAEYSYLQKDYLLLGFGSRSIVVASTFEEGVRKGEYARELLKTRTVCKDFQVLPQNTAELLQQIMADKNYRFYSSGSRFGVEPHRINTAAYFLPREGEGSFHYFLTKFAPISTGSLEGFKKSFSGKYPGLALGIGEECLEKLPGVLVQQAYHELVTGSAVPPSSELYSQLMKSDKLLIGGNLLNSKTINSLLTLAEQQTTLARYLKTAELEVVGVGETTFDSAVVARSLVEGSLKQLLVEVKSETKLANTAVHFKLKAPGEEAAVTAWVNKIKAEKWDEFVLLVNNVYKPTLEEQDKFRWAFAETYGKKIGDDKYKIVFMWFYRFSMRVL